MTATHEAAHDAQQAIHQEMYHLHNQADPRARIRLVDSKSLMPHRFGKMSGLSWRTWSFWARDIAVVAQPALKQATKSAENRKQQIPEQVIQDFGLTTEIGQELQQFLVSRTEAEALEVGRAAEREQGLEQWRRLASLCDPLAAGRTLDDSQQILSLPTVAMLVDFPRDLRTWVLIYPLRQHALARQLLRIDPSQ